jgi:hypothetical protein
MQLKKKGTFLCGKNQYLDTDSLLLLSVYVYKLKDNAIYIVYTHKDKE